MPRNDTHVTSLASFPGHYATSNVSFHSIHVESGHGNDITISHDQQELASQMSSLLRLTKWTHKLQGL